MLVEEELTYRIRGCVYEVSRRLGAGFLEKVYERALLREFELQGLKAKAQVPLKVSYKDRVVGEYFVDILVEDKVLIELKPQEKILPMHEAQLLNDLRMSDRRRVGLLVNFTYPKATIKRLTV